MKLEDLYFAPEDLYRLGNSSSPRLTNVRRPKDVDTIEVNAITIVVANGKGVSLSTEDRLDKTPMAGYGKLAEALELPLA